MILIDLVINEHGIPMHQSMFYSKDELFICVFLSCNYLIHESSYTYSILNCNLGNTQGKPTNKLYFL